MFNPKNDDTLGLHTPLLDSDVDLEGGDVKVTKMKKEVSQRKKELAVTNAAPLSLGKSMKNIEPGSQELIYKNDSKMVDMIEKLDYHQKIDNRKFVYMTNQNYVPADLDSEDEDPQEYANARKPNGPADDLDIVKVNGMVLHKFEHPDNDIRHLPDEEHVEKEDATKLPKIAEQLEHTRSYIQDIGASFGNRSFNNKQVDDSLSVVSEAKKNDGSILDPSKSRQNQRTSIRRKSIKDMFNDDETRRQLTAKIEAETLEQSQTEVKVKVKDTRDIAFGDQSLQNLDSHGHVRPLFTRQKLLENMDALKIDFKLCTEKADRIAIDIQNDEKSHQDEIANKQGKISQKQQDIFDNQQQKQEAEKLKVEAQKDINMSVIIKLKKFRSAFVGIRKKIDQRKEEEKKKLTEIKDAKIAKMEATAAQKDAGTFSLSAKFEAESPEHISIYDQSPSVQVLMQLREHMKKKIEDKRRINDHLSLNTHIRSDKGHALGIQYGKPDDIKDDDYIPFCAKCRQPNLFAHKFYYRDFHKDSRAPGHHYSLCQACVAIESGHLTKVERVDFYDGELTRHSINNSGYQWTCHTQSPKVQEWMKSLRIKDLNMRCLSGIDGIVGDNSKYQGYESRTSDFDICIHCLIALKNQLPFKDVQPFKKREFAHMLFPDTIPKPDIKNKKAFIKKAKRANSLYHLNSFADRARENFELDKDGIPDCFKNQVIQVHRSEPQDIEDQKMKGKVPEQIFKNLQQKFVDKCLGKKVSGSTIKIQPYEPKDSEDIQLGVLDIGLTELQACKLNYNLFQIEHKEMHILEKIGSFEGFLLVKCIESFIHEELGKNKQLIRTLRIYDLSNNYELLDSILLEQITAYNYDERMQRAHTSVLQNGHTIYYFRRLKIKEDGKEKMAMQLYSYDMMEKKKQLQEMRYQTYFKNHRQVREQKEFMVSLQGYSFIEENNQSLYIQFSQELSDIKLDPKVLENDHLFLSNFFVIKQCYYKQKSREELDKMNKNAIERKRLEENGEEIPDELKEKSEEHENEFEIYNFSYSQTEESIKAQLNWQDECARVRKNNNRKKGNNKEGYKQEEPPQPEVVRQFIKNKIFSNPKDPKCSSPVTQFHQRTVNLESYYSEKEKKERKKWGYESEPIKYKEINLSIQDDYQHIINFTEPRNYRRLKYPQNTPLNYDQTEVIAHDKDTVMHQKLEFENRIYTDCINDGHEPTTIEISPPFRVGNKIDQTFMIDNDQKIFLIYPIDYDEAQYAEVIDCVRIKLGGDKFFKKNGVKVIMQNLIKEHESHSMKNTYFKNLNLPLFENLNKYTTNFTEQQIGYHPFDLNDKSLKILIQTNLHETYLYLNSVDYGSRINIIKHTNDYTNCGTIKNDFKVFPPPRGDQYSAFIMDHQRLPIKQLVEGCDQKISRYYLNCKVHNIISSHHQIKINDPEKYNLKKDQEERMNPELIRVNQEADQNRMTLRDDLIKQDVIYIEKFVEPTIKKFLFIDDQDPSFKNLGQYYKVRLISNNVGNKIKFISYHRSFLFYVFVFQFDSSCYFFVRKSYKEIEQMDISKQNNTCVLSDRSRVQVLISQTKVQDCSLEQVKQLEKYKIRNVYCKFESIQDNAQPLEFIPFVALKCHSNSAEVDYDIKDNQIQSVYLSIFSIEKQEIVSYVSCNLNSIDAVDLGPNNIELCRSQNIYTHCLGLKFEKDMRFYIPEIEQLTQYTVAMSLNNQHGRFIFKSLMVEYKSINKDQKFQIKNKTTCQVIQTSRHEILPNANEEISFGQSMYKCIPYTDHNSDVKGIQMMIMNRDKTHFQVLNLLNTPEYNNTIKYQSDIIKYGHQRFYNIDNSNKTSVMSYYNVFTAELQHSFIEKKNLDHCERHIITKTILEQILQMIEFNFANQLTTSFQNFMDEDYFKTQEMLFGKSMVDINLNDDNSIKHALSQSIEIIQDNSKTLMFNLLESNPVRRKQYIDQNKIKKNLVVSLDFNFVSPIQRGYKLNAELSIQALLGKIFEIDTVDYHHILSLVMPMILKQDDISNIFYFFSRDKNQGQRDVCNMERFLFDPRLPLKSDKEIECYQISNFFDYNTYKHEVVDKIVKRDKMKDDQKQEKAIPVEHTFVDFQYMIIGEKLNYEDPKQVENTTSTWQNNKFCKCFRSKEKAENKGTKFMFDDLYVARMMIQDGAQNVDFYQQDAIQKIIDYQFTTTKVFFRTLMLSYVLFFMMPIIIVIFNDTSPALNQTCYFVAYFTSIGFVGYEIIQMKAQGKEYWQDGFNYADVLSFTIFFTLMIYQETHPGDVKENVYQKVLMVVLVLQMFMKILFFMKVYESYGFLVQMVRCAIVDALPFLVFFFLWVLFFAVQAKLLDWELSEDDEDSYNELPEFMKFFMLQFRNSLGDVILPSYSKWIDHKNSEEGSEFQSKMMIYLLWIFWFFNIMLMLIILLNFLIAVISATYEEVNSKKINYTYKDKAQMNVECCSILKSLYHKGEVKMIVFTYDKNLTVIEDSQFKEVLDVVRTSVSEITKEINTKFETLGDMVNKSINASHNLEKEIKKQAEKDKKDIMDKLAKILGEERMESKSAIEDNLKKVVMERMTPKVKPQIQIVLPSEHIDKITSIAEEAAIQDDTGRQSDASDNKSEQIVEVIGDQQIDEEAEKLKYKEESGIQDEDGQEDGDEGDFVLKEEAKVPEKPEDNASIADPDAKPAEQEEMTGQEQKKGKKKKKKGNK